MSKGDLDDLAMLWREDADPLEQEQLKQLAFKARRRGRLVDYADIAFVFIVLAGTAAALFAALSPLLLAAAALTVIPTIWLSLKRRKIRQMTRSLSTENREAFLETSIRSVKANLRRNMLSLIVFPLFAPVAVLLKVGSRTGGDPAEAFSGLLLWAASTRGMITLTIGFVLMAFVYRARRRHHAELRRLEDLRHAYEDEALRDREPSS